MRAEDASKINRIFERFNLATVDMAEIRSEIERSRQEQQAEVPEAPAAAEPMTEQEVESWRSLSFTANTFNSLPLRSILVRRVLPLVFFCSRRMAYKTASRSPGSASGGGTDDRAGGG